MRIKIEHNVDEMWGYLGSVIIILHIHVLILDNKPDKLDKYLEYTTCIIIALLSSK